MIEQFKQIYCIKLNVAYSDNAIVKNLGALFVPNTNWFIKASHINPIYGNDNISRYRLLKPFISITAIKEYILAQPEPLINQYVEINQYIHSIDVLDCIQFFDRKVDTELSRSLKLKRTAQHIANGYDDGSRCYTYID